MRDPSNSVRWAAAAEQFAANRQQQAEARAQGRPVMSDQQRQALQSLPPERHWDYAYRLPADDDLPNVPEPSHRSLEAKRSGAPDWQEAVSQAWAEAFAPLSQKGDQSWSDAIRYGQQAGILPTPEPAAGEPQAPDPEPAADPAPEPAPAPPPGPIDQLFQSLQVPTPQPQQPSDEAQLRNRWRSLPEAEREAVARWVEAQDLAPGYLGGLDPDWGRVLVGDALCSRMADARRLEPETTPEAFLMQVLHQAKGEI
jgi:hypothetical protein